MAKYRYPSIADQINKAHYDVYMSELYTEVPAYYLEFNAAPIYEHDMHRQSELSRGVATIAQMIDMHYNGYMFIIPRPEDVVDVYRLLTQYLNLLNETDNSNTVDLSLVKSKISKLLAELKIAYRRACIQLRIPAEEVSVFQTLLDRLFN